LCVVPVSSKVQDVLTDEYPDLVSKQLHLGWPDMESVADDRVQNDFDRSSVRFLFVGEESKRKGLRRAIDLVEAFRVINPNIRLNVFGVDPSDMPKKLLKKLRSYSRGGPQRFPEQTTLCYAP